MNTIFPQIILNKIYWYQWYYLQSNLCKQYHKRMLFNGYWQSTYIKSTRKKYWTPYNYRNIDSQQSCNIYNLHSTEFIADLPINYAYSNGFK